MLTPSMRQRGGTLGLGVAWNRVPPGRTSCPFHAHQREDEVFFVLEGTGVLRYGDELQPIRAGDRGKVLVRSLKSIGRLQTTEYLDGESAKPRIFELSK